MKTFLTRVELHGADLTDYELLHAEMANKKFVRTILSDDSKKYALPTAMYRSFGELSVTEVRELAQKAANTTRRSCWILVAE